MTRVLPPPGVYFAQIAVCLSGILSGIDVISNAKAVFKPFVSRFVDGSILSLGTIIKRPALSVHTRYRRSEPKRAPPARLLLS